jgi:adenosylmethionine---8-amino-7-oxononanoate aminotransferase
MMTASFDVAAADARHLWHPYTQHDAAHPPVEIVRGEGAWLVDARGRRIFDGISSWWVTLHGHAHPAIAEAIAQQARTLEQVIFAGFTHAPAARLAAELAARAPGELTRVFFSDDGSTSVEVAVKIALQYRVNRGERHGLIVALEHAYHGDTFGAMSVSSRGLFTGPYNDKLFEVARLPDPSADDILPALDDLLARRGSEIAALIVEPLLLGAGGMRVWSPDVLRALRERTREHGILLIADEVLTGFGRTGPLFACEHAETVPDIMCLSKGLTGGFLPLGATLVTDEVYSAFRSADRRQTLFHGHSYTANPIACASALASLALLDDDCARRRADIERAHREAARDLSSLPAVRDTRVLGTMFALDIAADDRGYLSGVGQELGRFALERGVLIRPLGDTAYLLPPYCATPDDLALAYSVLRDFLTTR